MIDLSMYSTEGRNPDTMNLDMMSSLEIAEQMNREDANAAEAVKQVLPQVAEAIDMAAETLKNHGRLIYIGAGTSGRLGVLDASECPPTFGVAQGMVIGLIAGGDEALLHAIEGAEDSTSLAEEELEKKNLSSKDMVIGLSASGRTPYVYYGLKYAQSAGCHTAAIVCNKASEIGDIAQIAIAPLTGAEVLTGSTRLKAGTAQKMILNMISTGSMAKLGKVYENLMVDLQSTNEKLKVRAENIVMNAAACGQETAQKALQQSDGNAKLAIVSILTGREPDEALKLLQESDDTVRKAIKSI